MAAEPYRGVAGEMDHAKWWLGLDIDEEVAALTSLLSGVRMRSAGAVRVFEAEGEPRGIPSYMHYNPPVQLPPIWRNSLIPPCDSAVNLSETCGLLASFSKLTPSSAITLLKAARHYSNALMIANGDPEQAWLQLVTAIEVVAVQYQAERFTDVELLEAAHAGLVKDVRAAGGEEIIPVIAKRLSRSMLATRRFLGFLRDFRPGPPVVRPQRHSGQVDWGQIDEALKDIYNHRSRLLHEGIPFPGPLLSSPGEPPEGDVVEERPQMGVIHAFGRAGWWGDTLPMRLHIFAYIVRRSIISWWESLAAQLSSGESGC